MLGALGSKFGMGYVLLLPLGPVLGNGKIISHYMRTYEHCKAYRLSKTTRSTIFYKQRTLRWLVCIFYLVTIYNYQYKLTSCLRPHRFWIRPNVARCRIIINHGNNWMWWWAWRPRLPGRVKCVVNSLNVSARDHLGVERHSLHLLQSWTSEDERWVYGRNCK